MPDFFNRYIQLVKDNNPHTALKRFDRFVMDVEIQSLELLKDQTYAPQKWTIKDIIQHVIDTERIFSYRALRFARKDATPLPGFEENFYALAANANHRSLKELLDEFSTQRKSTILLFHSFTDEMLHQKGVCFNDELTVNQIGFTIIGHHLHHLRIIKERYLPLIKASVTKPGKFEQFEYLKYL